MNRIVNIKYYKSNVITNYHIYLLLHCYIFELVHYPVSLQEISEH